MSRLHRIFYSISLLLLLFIGCSDSSTNTPYESESDNALKSIQRTESVYQDYLRVTQIINGEEGGLMVLAGSYKDIYGSEIYIDAKLHIPEGAFEGTQTITMTNDNGLAGINFSPKMVFDLPLKLDLTFYGLDLERLGLQGAVRFVYIGENGYIEPCENEAIQKIHPIGKLKVQKAYIEHFSRYAFAR